MMNISKHNWMFSSLSLFTNLLLTSCLLHLCEGESIFFKKDDIFTISGKIEPDSAIFFKNDSLISVNDNGKSLTLTCSSSCPVEWRLENFRLLSFPDDLKNSIEFRTVRKVSDFHQPANYEYIAEMKIATPTNKITGNYICQCAGLSSQRNSSIYVYWEGSSPSYLLQAGEHQTILRYMNDPFVRLECGASKPDQTIYLHKIDEVIREDNTPFSGSLFRSTATLMRLNESVMQDVDGFTLNIKQLRSISGEYICSMKSSLSEHDIAADGRSSTLQKRITIKTVRFRRESRQKQITSYRDMSIESENSVFYDQSVNRLICCHKHTSESHEQVGFYCETPLQCNFFKHRLTSGHNANEQNETCTAYKIGKNVYSGAATFRCLFNQGKIDLDVRGEQFFSLKSDTYFGLEEAIPNRMVEIKLENLNSTLFYGEPLKFKCQTASYPFSQGIVWMLKKRDGSQIVINNNEKETEEYKVERFNSDSEVTLRIFDNSVNRVECYAPLWNSDKWWSSVISLNLSESTKPMIIGDTDTTLRINAGDKVVTAECRASGIPKPHIKWRKDKKYFQPTVHVIESTSDRLVERIHIPLADIDKNEFDSYECVAISSVGEAVKTFHLRSKERNTRVMLIIGISVGLLVLFIIIMIFLLRKIFVQRRALRHLTKAEIEEFEKGKPEALVNWKGDINGCTHLLPYNQAYEIPRVILHIDESKILGQGTYGIVMKGYIKKGTRNEKIVAVKTIKPNEDVMHFKILLCELKIMAFIGSHPHIVSLVGACSRDIRNRELLVAIEYCDNGNMHDYLRKCRENYNNLFVRYDKKANTISTQGQGPSVNNTYANFPHASVFNIENNTKLDSKQLLIWASEIASGMEFLSSKKVIHGDLAARNILLSAENSAKIGDFGLSKQIFEYTTYTKKTIVLLPWKWMSLESLQDMTFSVMSDVWAYGVTLWEMFTLAQIPYPGTSWDDEFIDKLIGDYRLPQPLFASTEIYEVMLMCWARRPEYRPSFTDLKEKFTNFISELETKMDQTNTPNR